MVSKEEEYQMMISRKVNKCIVRYSVGAKCIEFEKSFGKGCDLVIIDDDKKHMYLIEVKRGNISISDVNKAIEQLSISEKILAKNYHNYKIFKILVHCKHGRFDSRARSKLAKNEIFKVTSYDVVDKISQSLLRI